VARTRTIRWTLVAAGATLLIAGAAAYLLLLPWLVRDRVRAVLLEAGFDRVTFDLSRSTLWSAQLQNVVLGQQDPVRIERIDLHYGPSILRTGHLQTIRLTGIELVGADEPQPGKAISLPIALRQLGRRSEVRDVAPVERTPHLPFDRVEIRDSTLIVPSPEGARRFSVRCDFDNNLQGHLQFSAGLEIDGSVLGLDGSFEASLNDLQATVSGPAVDATGLGILANAFLPHLNVHLSGQVDLQGSLQMRQEVVQLSLSIHPRELALLRGETNFQGINGVFQVNGRFGTVEPTRLAIAFADGTLEHADWDLEVDGLSGVVTLDSLSQLSTAGVQQFTVTRLALGEMVLLSGLAEFVLHTPEKLEVRRTEWGWLGGVLWAEEFVVDPTQAAIELTVRLKGVELQQLLDEFAQERASGDGVVSGELPVRIKWPDVEFGSGSLRATPGGSLQIAEVAEMAEDMVVSAMPGTAQREREQVQKNLVEALGDFRYDVLQAELRNGEGLSAHIEIGGRGRSGAQQEVNYQLNVHGLDALLKAYLGLRARLEQLQ
jgi:hypothetical protein